MGYVWFFPSFFAECPHMDSGRVLEDKKQRYGDMRWFICGWWSNFCKVSQGHHTADVLFRTTLLFAAVQQRWEETAKSPKVSVSIVNGERMVPDKDKSEQDRWAVTDSSSHLWRGVFHYVGHRWSPISLSGLLSSRRLKKNVNNLLKQVFFHSWIL